MSDQPFPSGAPSGTPNDLRAYVAVLRRRKWIVIIVTLLTVGRRVLLLPTDPHVETTARVLVQPLDPSQQGFNWAISMETEMALVVAGGRRPGRGDRRRGLEPGSVSASAPVNTTFLDITYSAPSGVDAQVWLALRQGYIENRAIEAQRVYDEETQVTREQLTSLQKQLSAAYEDLAQVTARCSVSRSSRRSTPSISRSSSARPSSHRPRTHAESRATDRAGDRPAEPVITGLGPQPVLAAIAGLVLGIGVAFVREQLDDRMNGPEDMEDRVGAPVMAVVPHFSGIRNGSPTSCSWCRTSPRARRPRPTAPFAPTSSSWPAPPT